MFVCPCTVHPCTKKHENALGLLPEISKTNSCKLACFPLSYNSILVLFTLIQHCELQQVAQLSQSDRAAKWVSFSQNINGRLCTTRSRCQKTKSIDRLYDKSTFIRKTVNLRFLSPLGPVGGARGTYAVHLTLIGKLLVDFLYISDN